MHRFPRTRRWLVAAATLAAAALVATPAGAAPSCSSLTPALYATVTCSYGSVGTATIAIPAGTGTISIDLYGAGGAGGSGGSFDSGANGGSGARVQATLDRTGLTSIAVAVGAGGSTSFLGGNGGGFVALYAGSSASDPVMAVAGGGGGGASSNGSTPVGGSGAAAGTAAGQAGVNFHPSNTGGAGGAGGTGGNSGSGSGCESNAGSSWAVGGGGGAPWGSGGGGGGGYGGGGGGCGSGGGAGGSYADPSRLVGAATYEPSPLAAGAGGTSTPFSPATAGGNGSAYVTFHPQSLTVTYAGNGATGGNAPTAATQDYGSTVTVATAGTLARTGYAFAGWNTSADGSGTAYAAGETFTLTSGQTLYAQWRSEPAAGGSAGAASTTSGSAAAKPAAVTLVTTAPRVTPAGPEVSFAATGPGTARISGTTTARADSAICSGTVKVRKASRVSIVCRLTATGRRLRAKAPLTIVLTTTFTAKSGAVQRATRTVVLPRRA